MPDNHLTELTGKVNLLCAFPHALQHVLAMFVMSLILDLVLPKNLE